MEVYLDLVILMNFGVDLLLLLASSCLSGRPFNIKKVLRAATLGGVYAGVCLLPGCTFLSGVFWRIVSLIAMALLAFGWNRQTVEQGAIFVFLSLALGGMVVLLGRGGITSVLLSALLLAMLCFVGFQKGRGKREYVSVEIQHKEKRVCMTALCDTGNTLRDPVSGLPVLVVDAAAAYRLLGLEEAALRQPIETISRGIYPGLRLIPYSAVGQTAGMMLGLRVDQLRFNGICVEQIVAFAPQRIGRGEVYEALAGGNV